MNIRKWLIYCYKQCLWIQCTFLHERGEQRSRSPLSTGIKTQTDFKNANFDSKVIWKPGALPNTNINTNVLFPSTCSVLKDINPSVRLLFCYSCCRVLPRVSALPPLSRFFPFSSTRTNPVKLTSEASILLSDVSGLHFHIILQTWILLITDYSTTWA